MEYKVPIEIVLQDPSSPIVPDTSDTTGGDGSASAPNTAVGEGGLTTVTKDSSSDGGLFGSASASTSIVAGAAIIMALAISATIAMLIHKYHKNKKLSKVDGECENIKTTKKEKLAAVATSSLAILAAIVLVGNLSITNTNAEEANEPTYLDVADKIQIIANRYEDVTIVASTKNISYATTDTTFGYKVLMSMAGDTANLYLDGDEASEYYFAPTAKTGLNDNSWGYSLDGEPEYYAMPVASDPLLVKQNTSAVEDEEIDIYYTMKADKDMPFGIYKGEISYTIEGYNGFPTSLTTMQGMTSAICAAVYTPSGSETVVPTATLTDIRDDKTYTIAKLADGKCWMTQNLDLQSLKQGVILDNTNTDNPASGFTLPTPQVDVTDDNRQWYAYDDKTGELLPSSVDAAHVYDLAGDGTDYHYCLRWTWHCEEEGERIPLNQLGNLYNWYAATAGTGTYSTGSTEDSSFEATGSICPAGWRLPNNSNSFDGSNYGITDYSNLLYQYGILKSATQSSFNSDKLASMFTAPLSLLPAGYYSFGVSNVGGSGYLWSSLASGSNNAGYFSFGTGSVSLWYSSGKYYGYSVRCVAQ